MNEILEMICIIVSQTNLNTLFILIMKRISIVLILFFVFINTSAQIRFNLDKERLSEHRLTLICDDELSWLRNEIYARHGYVFSNKEIQNHFSSCEWYTPATNNASIKLSQIEQANVGFLKKEEEKRKTRTNSIRAYFKTLKTNKSELNKIDTFAGDDLTPLLLKTLQSLDMDNMEFCGKKGLYQVTIDNGQSIKAYFLSVENNEIKLGYSAQGGSSILPQENDSDEDMISDESAQWWEFSINDNNQIKFIQICGAG